MKTMTIQLKINNYETFKNFSDQITDSANLLFNLSMSPVISLPGVTRTISNVPSMFSMTEDYYIYNIFNTKFYSLKLYNKRVFTILFQVYKRMYTTNCRGGSLITFEGITNYIFEYFSNIFLDIHEKEKEIVNNEFDLWEINKIITDYVLSKKSNVDLFNELNDNFPDYVKQTWIKKFNEAFP